MTVIRATNCAQYAVGENAVKNKRNRNFSEVVTLDVREQLKSILSRNADLFDTKEDLLSFEIKSGSRYKESTTAIDELSRISDRNIHSITLNIHTDDAPLVRTTKAYPWPC